MYEDLMSMDGLGALDTERLKADGAEYAVLGVSTVASFAVAKLVAGAVSTKIPWLKDQSWAKYAGAATPLIAGLAIGHYARGMTDKDSTAQRIFDGVALGMISYSIAAALSAIPMVGEYMPASLNGLGQTKDFSISTYLKGLAQAPSAVETYRRGLSQAPTSIETVRRGLAGAPTAIETESLNGYSTVASTLM